MPFDKFLLTWQGKVLNEQKKMNHRNLFSMSFASVGLLPEKDEAGQPLSKAEEPFCLDIEWVKATVIE